MLRERVVHRAKPTPFDFVGDAAVRAAKKVVMEQGLVRMSPEGSANFLEVPSRPAAPMPDMVELASGLRLGNSAMWRSGKTRVASGC